MRNQIITLSTIIILSLIPNFCFAQGCIMDEESYQLLLQLPKPPAARSVPPVAYSLEKFIPHAIDQKGTSNCGSFALSTINTILYAKNILKTTDKDEISRNRFSPTFLHYLIVNRKDDVDCDSLGLNGYKASSFMMNYGLPFMSDVEENFYHPYSNTMICNYYPYNETDLIHDIKKGSKFLFSHRYLCLDLVYDIDSTRKIQVNPFMLQSELYKGRPCYLSVNIDMTDRNSSPEGILKLSSGKSNFAHALVIIGYNDTMYGGAFQILNSWGEDWGINGMAWITEEDLKTPGGVNYILSFDGNTLLEEISEESISLLIKDNTIRAAYMSESKEYGQLLFKDDYPINEKVPIRSMCECNPNDYRKSAKAKPEYNADLFCACFTRICNLFESEWGEAPNTEESAKRFKEFAKRCFSEQWSSTSTTFQCIGRTKAGNRCKPSTKCSNLFCRHHGGDCY